MKKSSDNRNYLYNNNSVTRRVEFSVIEKNVGKNNKIIDLGCGDGSLMQILSKNGNSCQGMEISQSGVDVCKKRGLNVVKGRIDTKLSFGNKKFDVAVCNVTIQMVMYPEILLAEMKRISKKQIITFPNFGFILNRIELIFYGVFPKWSIFGYGWYSTGHIHQLSIRDFIVYCKENNLKILKAEHVGPGGLIGILLKPVVEIFPNLFATMAIFVTE